MPVIVSFMAPGELGSINAVGIGRARATESVATGSTSTAAAADGEIVYLVSTESAAVRVAIGSAPSTSATTATDATSAYVAIPPGVAIGMTARTGDKIAVAAI